MAIPKVRVKFDAVETDGLSKATIHLPENDYWTAQLSFQNLPAIYPATVDVGSDVLVEVQDGAVGGAWTTLFSGSVLYPDLSFGSQAEAGLQCVGEGYALNMMNCAEEYGTQSRNPAIDSIQSILTNASVGMIPKWVNHYRGGSTYMPADYNSGYTIDTANVENLTGSFPFISFPWKPTNKCIDDLCDLHTAIAQSTAQAGPHWICDHDGKLRLKRIGATQVGWTKYYGDSQANATLEAGVDFFDGDFQPVKKEANVILYYGMWRRPSSGDAWTENNASDWTVIAPAGCTIADDSDAGDFQVNTASLLITGNSAINAMGVVYPSTMDWGYDLTGFREYNVPTFNFWAKRSAGLGTTGVRLSDNPGNYFEYQFGGDLVDANQWYHISLPVGNFYKTAGGSLWDASGGGTWDDIDYVAFISDAVVGATLHIDGLHFGDAPLCRIARQEFDNSIKGDENGSMGLTTNPIKFKVFNDNVGKDDSLNADDDSGMLAQMTKYELIKLCKDTVNGSLSNPMIKDVLPGQYIHIAEDWRITKVTHLIPEFKTKLDVTDDLTNTHVRLRYEDQNKLYAAIRPEWQDRQASSLKVGAMDIRVLPLEKAYNI